MRAKLVEALSFQKQRDPKAALGLPPRKFSEFVKAFQRLKVSVELSKDFKNLGKYKNDSYILSTYYEGIGEEVGNFIAEFYKYDVPLDPKDEACLDPFIIKAIDNWLLIRYPNIEDNYKISFWEGLIGGIDF